MPDYKEHLFKSTDALLTEQFAEQISRQFKGGEIVELIGDVGSGKTTFVRGLAKGINSTDPVSSPTFAIYNVYQGISTMYHFDLYRLHEDSLIKNELAEKLADRQAVLVLEWANQVEEVLPAERLKIEFKTTGEAERTLKVFRPAVYKHLEIS